MYVLQILSNIYININIQYKDFHIPKLYSLFPLHPRLGKFKSSFLVHFNLSRIFLTIFIWENLSLKLTH